jgi:hypothetical protein
VLVGLVQLCACEHMQLLCLNMGFGIVDVQLVYAVDTTNTNGLLI